MNLSTSKTIELNPSQFLLIDKRFIVELASTLQKKDYVVNKPISVNVSLSDKECWYENIKEFMDNYENAQPKSFSLSADLINYGYITTNITNHPRMQTASVSILINSDSLSEAQHENIILDVSEDFTNLLHCFENGNNLNDQEKKYSYTIRKQADNKRKRTKSLIKSPIFWAAAGAIFTLIGVLVSLVFNIIK